MGNDARKIRGKLNSSAPGPGSGSGSVSGLRMSTRSRTRDNSSPGSVRKSQRLENRVSGSGSPLRRSSRDRKLQSPLSKPGSKKKGNNHGGLRKKGKVKKEVLEVEEDDEFEMWDKTLMEIVEEVRDSSPKIGEKRKKGAKGKKNNGGSSSETKSKKRKLDSCFDNVDSGLGGTLDVVLGNGGENVDSSGLKLEEGLEVKCEEDGGSGYDTDEEVRENCVEDVDRGLMESGEEPQERRDRKEFEDCEKNIDDCTEGFCSDANSSFGVEKPNEVVGGTLNEKNVVHGLVEEVNGSVVERFPNQEELEKDCPENTDDCTEGLCSDVKSSFCVEKHGELVDGTQNAKNVVNGLVEDGSVVEKLPNQDAQLALGRAADNTNYLRCSVKELTVGAVDHDSPTQDPCSRVLSSMGSENLIPVSKDRGECSMDEDSHIANSSNSLFGGNQASIVSCKSAANLLWEYWVPVEISNVQLEQYCSVMLSNSTVLRLCSKRDPMGSLREILISIMKCCDHPYLGNPSLRNSLLPEQPSQDAALDMGVKASGKLQLLDKILSEFRNQGLKVVILFQSIGGSGKDNLEVVLDDLLTWRFGKDSFEYAASGGQPSKKHAALNKFNRERDVSFLLLETRACHPSVKLSSVDSVIILNSDWNPLNDLRALQKITIDSRLKPIKVFRFYCSCTFEEKALIFAKNTLPDNTVPVNPMNPSAKQALLMWGSSYLFSRLDKFHQEKVHNYRDNVALGSSFVTDVFQEIVSLVKNDGNVNPSGYVSEAGLDGRCYRKNIPLFGEQRNHLEEGVSSYTFWMKLLEGKQPQWKFLSGSSDGNRKRVAYSDNLSSPPDATTDEPVKKCRDSSPRKAGQHPEDVKDKSNGHQGHPDTGLPAHDGRSGLHDQRGLFEMLKPTVSRLCETLMLKDEVKRLAGRFLEYVLNNHRVTKEPETILQAFQISVCWTAAEVLEKNIDHRKSLDIAVEKMDFKCLEQEADSVYGKMKLPMKIFLSQNLKILKSSVDPASATDDGTHDLTKNCESISNGSSKNVTKGLEKVNKEVCSPSRMTNKEKDSILDSVQQRKKAELDASFKVDSAVIRYSYAKSTDVVEKLKILENDYAKKREDLDKQIYNQRKELDARQLEERDGEQKKIAQLLELLKPVVLDEQVPDLPSANSVDSRTAEHKMQSSNSNGSVLVTDNLPAKQKSGGEVCGTHSHALSSHNIDNLLNRDDTDQMNTVSMGKNGVAAIDLDNGVSTSFCCASRDQPTSLVSTFRKHQNADGITCQDIGDELCQQRGEGEEEQVHPCTDNCSTSLGGETLLLDKNRCASDSQLHNRPNEVQTAVQNSCTQMQQQIPHREAARSVDANIDQGVSSASVPRGVSTVHASHSNQAPVAPTISWVPSSHRYDPLQIEFDRIRKRIGETINDHEEAKIRLKSECQKEIEELVAQIQRKYYVKLEEAESSFSIMKNELEMNQNMVVMNKFLAGAFRYKCMDSKAGSTVKSQKGISSCLIELPSPLQHVTGPFSASASFSSDPSASSPMSTRPSVQGALPSSLPAFNLPTRSPHMRTSPGGLQQARYETREPGLHLQHSSFRSTMPINNKHPSSVLPLQPPKNNHLASLSATQLPAKPLTFQNTHAQSHPGSKQSLTDLLMEMGRQNDTIIRRLSENLPDGPSNMPDHESRIFSQFGSAALSEIEKAVDPTGDVVCSSDDD